MYFAAMTCAVRLAAIDCVPLAASTLASQPWTCSHSRRCYLLHRLQDRRSCADAGCVFQVHTTRLTSWSWSNPRVRGAVAALLLPLCRCCIPHCIQRATSLPLQSLGLSFNIPLARAPVLEFPFTLPQCSLFKSFFACPCSTAFSSVFLLLALFPCWL